MANNSINLRKIYKFFKEAEPFREAGLNAPHRRSQMAREIIDSTSKQNTVVAAAFFIPGSDMPLLTLNQMKMVIELAALYGQKISIQRAAELLAAFGGGFALRAFARGLVEFIPGPGIIVKVGTAYSGTKAVGKLAQKYFEAISIAHKTAS